MHLPLLLLLGAASCATIEGPPHGRPSIVHAAVLRTKRLPKNLFDLSSLPAYQDQDLNPFPNPHQAPRQKRQARLARDPGILQTALPQLRAIRVFAAYVRDSPSLAPQTEWTNATMVVVAPSDHALNTMLGGKKPWEFPEPLDADPADSDAVAARNLEHFLNAHIVSDLALSIHRDQHGFTASLINGKSIAVGHDAMGVKWVQVAPGARIPVVDTVQVDNGLVLVIDNVLV